MDLKNYFGVALSTARKNKGYSQLYLAELADLDRTYISMLERGIRHPSLEAVFALSKALNLSSTYLLESMESNLYEIPTTIVTASSNETSPLI